MLKVQFKPSEQVRPVLAENADFEWSAIFVPTVDPCHKQTMNAGLRLNPLVLHKVPLDLFKESFLGSIHEIWNELPPDLIMVGRRTKWARIEKECKKIFKKGMSNQNYTLPNHLVRLIDLTDRR